MRVPDAAPTSGIIGSMAGTSELSARESAALRDRVARARLDGGESLQGSAARGYGPLGDVMSLEHFEDRVLAAALVRKRAEARRRSAFPSKPCAECGETFQPRAGNALYCSKTCVQHAFQRRKREGAGSPDSESA